MFDDVTVTLTPEQVAAVTAGQGLVYAEDPSTHQLYTLIRQEAPTIHSDDELRLKIAEGLAELARGERIPWDVDAFKLRLAERLSREKGE